MSTTTEQKAAPSEAAPEGSFGNKPSADQVALMERVMAKVAKERPTTKPAAPDTQQQKEAAHAAPEDSPEEAAAAAKAASEPAPDPVEDTVQAEHEEEAEEAPESPEEKAESKGWPDSAKKRTAKLTAQKKELEAKAAQLEARLKELEATAAAKVQEANAAEKAPAPEAAAQFDSLDAVASQRDALEAQLDWLEEHRHAGYESDDGELSFTPEQLTAEWRAKKAALRELPKVESALRQRDEVYRPQLKERYDWWGQADDPRYQQVQATLKQFPELRRAPNHELILAGAAEQEHVWKAEGGDRKPEKTQVSSLNPQPSKKTQVSSLKSQPSEEPPPVPATGAHARPTQPRASGRGLSQQDLEATRSGNRSGTVNLVKSLLRTG